MFKNLRELILSMPTEETCRAYLAAHRWPDGKIACPHCGQEDKVYVIEGGKKYKCASPLCYKKFSVTVGTVFECSNLPLTKWFVAVYLISAHKKGISSHQLARDLGISQKASWFMIQRIREALKIDYPELLSGVVQSDETYMGRKYRSDYVGLPESEIDYKLSRPHLNKGMVLGFYDKKTKTIRPIAVNSHLDGASMTKLIADNVKRGSTIHTDESKLYTNAERNGYYRESVHHGKRQWVKPSLSAGKVHTNNVENFWGVMKRGIHGTYHQVSNKHLQRYCDEFAFRFNNRHIKDYERFNLTLRNIEGRLTYNQLVYNADKKPEKNTTNPKA